MARSSVTSFETKRTGSGTRQISELGAPTEPTAQPAAKLIHCWRCNALELNRREPGYVDYPGFFYGRFVPAHCYKLDFHSTDTPNRFLFQESPTTRAPSA